MSNSGPLSPWHTAPGDLKLVRVQALALYGAQGKSLLLSGPQFSLSADDRSFDLDGGMGHLLSEGKSYCCLQPKCIILQ